MVDVTHDGDDRRTRHEVFLTVVFFCFGDGFLHISTNKVDLETKLLGHHRKCLSIKALVDGNRHTKAHAGTDDLHDWHVHHRGQFVGGHKLGHLQDFLVLLLTHHFLHHATRHLLTLLAAVL